MAEGVIVEGFSGNAKEWANETTLKAVLETLKDLEKISEKSANMLIKAHGSKEEMDEHLMQELEKAAKAQKQTTETTKDLGDEEVKTTKKTKGLGNAMGKLVAGDLTKLATGFGILAGTIMNQMNLAKDLNDQGLNLGRNVDGAVAGLNSFTSSATEANLTFKELSDISKRFGFVMNQVGVKQFGTMARSVSDGLGDLGVNSLQGAEYLAEYLGQQKLMGINTKMSQAEQIQGAVDQMKMVDKWSKTLGKSREEIQKGISALKSDTNVQAMLSRSTDAVRKGYDQFAASIGGFDSQAGGDMMQALANPVIQQSELFQQLIAAGMSEAANELMNLQKVMNSDAGEAEKAAATDRYMKLMAKQDTQLGQLIGSQATAAIAAVNSARAYNDAAVATDKETETQKKQAKATKAGQETWKKFQNLFTRIVATLFSSEKNVNMINNAIESMAKGFEEYLPPIIEVGAVVMNSLLPVLGSLVAGFVALLDLVKGPVIAVFQFLSGTLKDFVDAVTWIITPADKLTNSMEDGVSATLKLSKAFGALAAYFLARIAIMKAKDAISNKVTNNAGSSIGNRESRSSRSSRPSNRGGGRAGKAGGALAKLLKGLGTGIGGILKGFATGLTAFANPLVIAGAAGFAAAMTVLSAGLSASAYIISLSMPSLVESMEPLEKLDGQALVDAGAGIAAVGAGLAVFGSGGAIGAIGDALGSMVSGIAGFFGADSPIDKLKEFAAIGEDLSLAGDGMIALTNGLSTLNNAIDDIPDLDKLEELTKIITKGEPRSFGRQRSRRMSRVAKKVKEDTAKVQEDNPSLKPKSETAANAKADASKEINTLLTKQTELLEILVRNSSAQLDNVKKLRRSTEDNA